jgi:hypothetical protein
MRAIEKPAIGGFNRCSIDEEIAARPYDDKPLISGVTACPEHARHEL